MINGASILITGGSGSFGRAFIPAALAKGAKRVCIFSRSESVQAEMREVFDDDRLRWFIGDVRDRDRLRRAMEGVDLVVHAAALKRIEVGHYNPTEMVKTNVIGAMNVIEAAHDAGVSRVVALSTDKAYQPVSPYGCSKAISESLFISANNARGSSGPMFAVTRYGNVAGSRGSVIPKWRSLIAAGKRTVTVTDPDVTRFWMTIDDAVNLVTRTAETMTGGELVIPELPAFRLGDLVEAMDLQAEVTGLPAWEKKHESMRDGLSSDTVRRMTVSEIREALNNV